MLIQSKKIWIADQFVPAIIEMRNGKITEILPYESKPVDVDYGDKRSRAWFSGYSLSWCI